MSPQYGPARSLWRQRGGTRCVERTLYFFTICFTIVSLLKFGDFLVNYENLVQKHDNEIDLTLSQESRHPLSHRTSSASKGGAAHNLKQKNVNHEHAFESALSDVLTKMVRKKNATGGNTRRHFNLTTWAKRTKGGLRDLDRLKLAEIYRNANSVFEWGLGESSFIAAEVGVPRYTGIDSDPIWIKEARDGSPDHFRFHLGDIGPTGSWGRPEKSRLQKAYLNYQFEPLLSENSFDVYFVDGRMRPACALVAFLHASARGDTEEERSPTVIIHDYYHDIMSQNCSDCRKFKWQYPYHRIEEVADLVDHSRAMLAVFKRKKHVSDDEIKALWEQMGLGDT